MSSKPFVACSAERRQKLSSQRFEYVHYLEAGSPEPEHKNKFAASFWNALVPKEAEIMLALETALEAHASEHKRTISKADQLAEGVR